MLPSILTSSFLAKSKTTVIAAVTAVALVASGTAPAQAWGKPEQQFLAGAATAVLLGSLILNSPRYGNAQPQYQPRPQYLPRPHRPQRPVYYTPAPVSIYGTPTGRAFNSYTSNERRRIQSTLTAYGYYHGGIDGAFGPTTYSAIDAYARNTGKSASLSTSAGAYGLLDGLLF